MHINDINQAQELIAELKQVRSIIRAATDDGIDVVINGTSIEFGEDATQRAVDSIVLDALVMTEEEIVLRLQALGVDPSETDEPGQAENAEECDCCASQPSVFNGALPVGEITVTSVFL